MVIVTKCPDDIKPIDFNIIAKRLHLYPYQQLYFSRFRYGMLTPLFPEKTNSRKVLSSLTRDEQVLLVTGIASPAPLQKEVESYTPHVKLLSFDDHHDFTHRSIIANKGTIPAPGRVEKTDNHHGERCGKAETPSRTGRNTKAVHLRAADRNRNFTKSTIYI